MRPIVTSTLIVCLLAALNTAEAKKWTFNDPAGDDNGPGGYVYPTDKVYAMGSFDLRQVQIRESKNGYQISVAVTSPLDNPWKMAGGFSVQMVQVYFDLDNKPKSGQVLALPGMNAKFAEDAYWEKAVILSPQPDTRVKSELEDKLPPEARKNTIIPVKVNAVGNRIVAEVAKEDLGELPERFGVQVLLSSNEGFPDGDEILSRKVNEYEGPHRFGGGSDYDGDPHFVDMLVSPARGKKDEVKAQHEIMSRYVSRFEPEENEFVELTMVYTDEGK